MTISIFLQTRPKPIFAPSNENHYVTDYALTRVEKMRVRFVLAAFERLSTTERQKSVTSCVWPTLQYWPSK